MLTLTSNKTLHFYAIILAQLDVLTTLTANPNKQLKLVYLIFITIYLTIYIYYYTNFLKIHISFDLYV